MKIAGIILLVIGIFSIPNSLEVLPSSSTFGYKLGYILPTILFIGGGVLLIKRSTNK